MRGTASYCAKHNCYFFDREGCGGCKQVAALSSTPAQDREADERIRRHLARGAR